MSVETFTESFKITPEIAQAITSSAANDNSLKRKLEKVPDVKTIITSTESKTQDIKMRVLREGEILAEAFLERNSKIIKQLLSENLKSPQEISDYAFDIAMLLAGEEKISLDSEITTLVSLVKKIPRITAVTPLQHFVTRENVIVALLFAGGGNADKNHKIFRKWCSDKIIE